jgi:bifunctional pyridoxal-dependent enzyme with beta-cystathionase and maltose regulon repressor activities
MLMPEDRRRIVDTGLKYVHNDTCYPALLVIGQLIDAVNSGRYDRHKVGLLITQTGGGCRASNYIHLLRKALQKAGMAQVPVISLNPAGLEKNSGFRLAPTLLVQATLMILSNPQNPSGKIWTKDELSKIGELAYKNGVFVISDEIHCDLVDPGYSYTPFASVSRACARVSLSLVSPSKTFNLAGIHSSAVVVLNENLRNKIARGLKMEELSRPGVFAIDTTIAAYTKGADWVDELRSVLADNKQYVRERLKTELPKVKVIYSHGTYLMWLDCSAITNDADSLIKLIRERSGLVLTSGTEFRGHGNCFLRMNAATQRERLADGVDRLVKALKDL